METELMEVDNGAVLKLTGRLDTKTAKEASETFSKVGEQYDNVTLDMAGISYISSAGIRAIRNLYMILYRKGGKLAVTNPGDVVVQVFQMTGLASLFDL